MNVFRWRKAFCDSTLLFGIIATIYNENKWVLLGVLGVLTVLYYFVTPIFESQRGKIKEITIQNNICHFELKSSSFEYDITKVYYMYQKTSNVLVLYAEGTIYKDINQSFVVRFIPLRFYDIRGNIISRPNNEEIMNMNQEDFWISENKYIANGD